MRCLTSLVPFPQSSSMPPIPKQRLAIWWPGRGSNCSRQGLTLKRSNNLEQCSGQGCSGALRSESNGCSVVLSLSPTRIWPWDWSICLAEKPCLAQDVELSVRMCLQFQILTSVCPCRLILVIVSGDLVQSGWEWKHPCCEPAEEFVRAVYTACFDPLLSRSLSSVCRHPSAGWAPH